MKKYSRVSYSERCQIYALMQAKKTITEIARQLHRHKSTISREVRRNLTCKPQSDEKEYHPLRAQGQMIKRKKFCRRKLKLKVNDPVVPLIESLLVSRWSPEIIAGRLKREGLLDISFQSLYRFIRDNPRYEKYLMHYRRKRFKYKRCKAVPRPGWWKSIKERPTEANMRTEVGHWERDCMLGINRKQGLLVCTDRKSRFTRVGCVHGLTSRNIADKTLELLGDTINKKVKTVTNDNGVEFKSPSLLPYPVYYCNPYTPQERGTVENTIGVIRRFYPKKTNVDDINLEGLEKWLNNRPRKVLDFKTPYEVYYEVDVALGT